MRFLGFFLLFPSGAFPTEFSSGVTRRHFFRGRSTTLLGKVSFFPVGPSPALRLPTALCVTSGGEGQDDFGRPSPNAPGTFPTETTFGAKQSCRTALPPRRDAGTPHNPVAGRFAASAPLFPLRQDAGTSHNPVARRIAASLPLFPLRQDAGASHNPVAERFAASAPLFPLRRDAGAFHNPVAERFAASSPLFPLRQDAGTTHNPVAGVMMAQVRLFGRYLRHCIA